MAARTQYETFNRDWQQTVAWAQTQGIGPSSYLPVYQMDLQRISTGGSGYAMGRAERNNAIIAAHNPNQVTPVPSDNPSPTHIWSNAASDVGKIATGLAGIFTGSFEKQIWHSAEATVRGVEDPASLDGHGIGGTIGNWLNDTLLAYVPGAADLGTLFQQGPIKGLDALASHPVLSLLDVMPDIGGEESAIARIAGRVDPALKESIGHLRVPMLASGLKAGGKHLGDLSIGGKAGSNIYGQWKEKLSVSDRLQGMLAKSPGVGPLFSKLGSDSAVLASMGADEWNAIMGPVSQDLETLAKKDPEGVALLKKAMSMKDLTKGDSIDRLMKDPKVSPAVKVAAKKWMEGPGRFVVSESAFRAGLLPYYDNSGNISMHAAVGPSAVGFRAVQKELEQNRDQALAGITELEPHAERLAALDSIAQRLAERWAAGVDAARQGVVNRPEFQTTIEATSPLRRDAQLRAVIDEGGLVDDFKRAISTEHPDPATVEYLAGEMMKRLSTWGVRSVNGMKVPELVELYKAAAGWRLWAKHYHKEQDSLDRAIEGHAKAQQSHAAQAREDHKARIEQLNHQHQVELANLEQTHQRAQGELATRMATFTTEQRRSTLAQIKDMRNQASIATQDMTPAQAKAIQAELAVRERRLMDSLTSRIRESRKGLTHNVETSKLKHRLAKVKMTAKHKDERAALARALEKERRGYSDLTDEVGRWASTVKKYHRYLYDHPADQYRDAFQEIWKKKLMKLEDTARIKVMTEKFLSKQEKDAKAKVEIDKIRNDPGYLAEYTVIHWGSIMRQPEFDVETRAIADAELEKYADDARQTINQMVAQGFKLPYIPSATVFSDELGPGSILATVSHGIKRPDVDKAKTWMQFTPTKDDFAVGMNKAVVQELDRQAKIHMFEDTLAPMTLTRDELSAYIHLHGDPVQKAKMESLTAKGSLVALADEFGWRQFDTTAYMGGRLPRWGDQEIFLPKEVGTRALDKMDHKQKDWLLTKGTKLFRYSILGLSPRYDAHVIFGGALMLALRSTPYILSPDIVGRAWEAVRTGTLPSGFGHPAEEGYEAPTGVLDRVTQATMDEWHHASAKDLVNLEVGEHIETKQGVSRYAAKPIHALRALAELNLGFTRHIREMQNLSAYFDAVGKYERQHGGAQFFTDPDTGREIRVTPERAMKEGMHHVQQVYGNLAAMSPFEQQVARTVMPFYGWQKHVIGYILSFPFDHPMRALILSQMAYQASNDVPKSWPIRIQFLHFLGAPDKNGNIKAIDLRSLDPFRDVANYMSLTGVFESLNPALSAPLTMAFGSQAVYGESSLYPGMSYNAFYGINTANSGGNVLTAAEAYVPQIGAIQSALALATNARSEWKTNPSAAAKTLLEQLNIPFLTPDVNLKQQSARSEAARYEQAYNASKSAFSSGDFSQLKGYPTIPNPLNPAYTMTPAELEALYNQQQAVYPGISPAETALPPPTPYGW